MDMNLNTDSKFLSRIEDALTQLRPYLEADNGNVSLVEVTDDMVVKLRFHGACSGCSMSMMTLKAGIEQTILRMVPEVKSVVAVDVEEDELS
jgi:Fe-S cluster biogenesis protein NfuA